MLQRQKAPLSFPWALLHSQKARRNASDDSFEPNLTNANTNGHADRITVIHRLDPAHGSCFLETLSLGSLQARKGLQLTCQI